MAASLFQSHGVESPRLEAEMLAAFCVGCSRTSLLARLTDPFPPEGLRRLAALVERRLKGEPVHYLIGTRDFMGLELAVDSRVLIPRSDTEVLVERALQECEKAGRPLRIADIGTGSGAIILAMAYHLKGRGEFWAVDLSPDALEVARANARSYGLEEKIGWLQGDLLAPLESKAIRVDLLLSNPPYIREDHWRQLAPEVRDYEPKLALTGGEDGLDYYRRLAADAPKVLAPEGRMLLEIGHDQGDTVLRLLEEVGCYRRIEVIADWQGHPRVVCAQLAEGGKKP